jgi:hypothetical protein
MSSLERNNIGYNDEDDSIDTEYEGSIPGLDNYSDSDTDSDSDDDNSNIHRERRLQTRQQQQQQRQQIPGDILVESLDSGDDFEIDHITLPRVCRQLGIEDDEHDTSSASVASISTTCYQTECDPEQRRIAMNEQDPVATNINDTHSLRDNDGTGINIEVMRIRGGAAVEYNNTEMEYRPSEDENEEEGYNKNKSITVETVDEAEEDDDQISPESENEHRNQQDFESSYQTTEAVRQRS